MEIGDGEYSFNTIYLYIILKLISVSGKQQNSFNTIYLYIILKLTVLSNVRKLVLIPYIFTSFSNVSFSLAALSAF